MAKNNVELVHEALSGRKKENKENSANMVGESFFVETESSQSATL